MNQCPSLNDTDINWRCVSIIGQKSGNIFFLHPLSQLEEKQPISVVITNQNQSISAKSLCGTTGDCWWQVSIYYLLVFDKNAIPLSGNLKMGSGNPVQGNLEKSQTRYFATTSNPSINYCRIIVLNSDQFEINVEASPIVIIGESIISR